MGRLGRGHSQAVPEGCELVSITFVVATTGRDTLSRTLASIEAWPGDEVLVVCDDDVAVFDTRCRVVRCPRGGDWGHSERNFVRGMARTSHVAHMDDDDVYAPGARVVMEDAAVRSPGVPTVFRMKFWHGLVLWREEKLECGNVGTPMFLWPNRPELFGTWQPFVGGDFAFVETSAWKREEYVWRPEVIAHLRPELSH